MAAGSIASSAMAKPTMTAQQTTGGIAFDNSGWSVNLGLGGSATMANTTDRSASALGVSKALNNPTLLILLAVGLYLVLGKK